MRKSKFTESQIVGILNEVEAGMKVNDVCRKHEFSNQTYHTWKSIYGRMGVSDIKRLKELEEENARVERFNGSFRKEMLDCYIFHSLTEVRGKSQEWMVDYNYHRPHESLGDLSPLQFLEQHNQIKKLLA